MSNWCRSYLRVSSENRKQLNDFIEKVRARQGTGHLVAVDRELRDNWSPTRVFPVDNITSGRNWVKYKYKTSFSPALEWIKIAARMYPNLEFSLKYFFDFDYEGWFKAHGDHHEGLYRRRRI